MSRRRHSTRAASGSGALREPGHGIRAGACRLAAAAAFVGLMAASCATAPATHGKTEESSAAQGVPTQEDHAQPVDQGTAQDVAPTAVESPWREDADTAQHRARRRRPAAEVKDASPAESAGTTGPTAEPEPADAIDLDETKDATGAPTGTRDAFDPLDLKKGDDAEWGRAAPIERPGSGDSQSTREHEGGGSLDDREAIVEKAEAKPTDDEAPMPGPSPMEPRAESTGLESVSSGSSHGPGWSQKRARRRAKDARRKIVELLAPLGGSLTGEVGAGAQARALSCGRACEVAKAICESTDVICEVARTYDDPGLHSDCEWAERECEAARNQCVACEGGPR